MSGEFLGDHGAIGVVVGDVELVGFGDAALGGDLGGHLPDGDGVALEQRDLRPFAGHLLRDRPTEALSGAGNDTNLVGQQIHAARAFRYLAPCPQGMAKMYTAA